MPRSPDDRAFRELVFALFPYPRRLRALIPGLWLGTKLGIARAAAGPLGKVFPQRIRQLLAMSPAVTLRDTFDRLPHRTPARGEQRARVALVAGCVQRALFPNVNAATIRVLAAEGCEVIVPRGQGCCGALSLHSGRPDEAKRFARRLIERFEREAVDAIIINAAGCGSTLKGYGELFAEDPEWRDRAVAFEAKVRDVNEYLATLEPRAARKPLTLKVAYHDACHLAHAQRVREQPRTLLRTIPGLRLCEIPNGDQCCGSAGTYNLFQPESAHEIGMRKVDNVASIAPDMVASANPGCTLQMLSIFRERGIRMRSAHPDRVARRIDQRNGAGVAALVPFGQGRPQRVLHVPERYGSLAETARMPARNLWMVLRGARPKSRSRNASKGDHPMAQKSSGKRGRSEAGVEHYRRTETGRMTARSFAYHVIVEPSGEGDGVFTATVPALEIVTDAIGPGAARRAAGRAIKAYIHVATKYGHPIPASDSVIIDMSVDAAGTAERAAYGAKPARRTTAKRSTDRSGKARSKASTRR